MKFQGKLFKDGKFWLAEVPFLELMTQGKTRKECLKMVEDLFVSLTDSDVEINVQCTKAGDLEIGTNNSKVFIGLLLKRKRHLENLSIQQVVNNLGSTSKTAYARYEQGKTLPSFDKLEELLCAISPSSEIVINQSKFSKV